MSYNSAPGSARLFRFSVPGLDDALAIPLGQMMGVARLPFVTRIPCTPAAILGLGRWQEQPVMVLDLAAILAPAGRPADLAPAEQLHMIARTAFGEQVCLVACPIRPGGQIINVPLKVPGAALPDGLAAGVVHQAALIDGAPTLLIDLLRLPGLLAAGRAVG